MRTRIDSFHCRAVFRVTIAAAGLLLLSFHAAAAPNRSRTAQASGQTKATPDEPALQVPPQTERQIFDKPIPAAKLVFLQAFSGQTSAQIVKDKQFRKLIDTISPNAPIHIGHDRDVSDALELALAAPGKPASIRDSRYMMISSNGSPKAPLRGFVWIDLQ